MYKEFVWLTKNEFTQVSELKVFQTFITNPSYYSFQKTTAEKSNKMIFLEIYSFKLCKNVLVSY